MVNIPKIKKRVNTFLTKEEGKISKESLIKTGLITTIIAISTTEVVDAGHSSHNNHFLECDIVDPLLNDNGQYEMIYSDMQSITCSGQTGISAAHSNFLETCTIEHDSHSDHSSHGSHSSW